MTVTDLHLDRVHPDPDNVRSGMVDTQIDELAASIKAVGLMQPLVAYMVAEGEVPGVPGGDYVLAAGHRRYIALRAIGANYAPVMLRPKPIDDLARLDLLGTENLQRRDLNPIEEAKYYKRYTDRQLTQEQVAKRVGVNQNRITKYLSLLELSPEDQLALACGDMPPTVGATKARKVREAAGTARAGRPNANGYYRATPGMDNLPHFNKDHPLASAVAQCCSRMGHLDRLGPGCGHCWERVIRRDEAGQRRPDAGVGRNGAAPTAVARQCQRCGAVGLDLERACTLVRDGKRHFFEKHQLPVPAQRV